MCRLLGVVSAVPVSIADAVGDTVLKDFVALTKIHGDGWGVGNAKHLADPPRVRVSAGGVRGDARLGEAIHAPRSTAAPVRLRGATSGPAVEPRNSHPFLADGL